MTATVPATAQPATPALDLDAIEARVEKAHDHIAKLCSGDERWTVRVPAQLEHDSDLVIGTALNDVDRLVAKVRRLRAELVNEQAAHKKTCVNFDDFAEGAEQTAHDSAGQLRDARRQVETWRGRALGAEALLHNMGARRDAEGAWQPPSDELDATPAAATTYALPAEPPPDTTRVWDDRECRYDRLSYSWVDEQGWYRTWARLVYERGPLSSVPPAGTEGG